MNGPDEHQNPDQQNASQRPSWQFSGRRAMSSEDASAPVESLPEGVRNDLLDLARAREAITDRPSDIAMATPGAATEPGFDLTPPQVDGASPEQAGSAPTLASPTLHDIPLITTEPHMQYDIDTPDLDIPAAQDGASGATGTEESDTTQQQPRRERPEGKRPMTPAEKKARQKARARRRKELEKARMKAAKAAARSKAPTPDTAATPSAEPAATPMPTTTAATPAPTAGSKPGGRPGLLAKLRGRGQVTAVPEAAMPGNVGYPSPAEVLETSPLGWPAIDTQPFRADDTPQPLEIPSPDGDRGLEDGWSDIVPQVTNSMPAADDAPVTPSLSPQPSVEPVAPPMADPALHSEPVAPAEMTASPTSAASEGAFLVYAADPPSITDAGASNMASGWLVEPDEVEQENAIESAPTHGDDADLAPIATHATEPAVVEPAVVEPVAVEPAVIARAIVEPQDVSAARSRSREPRTEPWAVTAATETSTQDPAPVTRRSVTANDLRRQEARIRQRIEDKRNQLNEVFTGISGPGRTDG